jgi:hypothetical protein
MELTNSGKLSDKKVKEYMMKIGAKVFDDHEDVE